MKIMVLIFNSCRQLYNKVGIVGLYFCLVRRLVSYDLTAPVTPVYDNKSLFCVRLGTDWTQNSHTGVCAVARVNIHVQ